MIRAKKKLQLRRRLALKISGDKMPARISEQDGISFDDVLLKPQCSEIFTRKDVSTSARLFNNFYINTPVISANMDTVTEWQMANTLFNEVGAVGAIHRFMDFNTQLDQLSRVQGLKIVSVGVGSNTMENIKTAVETFGEDTAILIDIAHGHSSRVFDLMEDIRAHYSIPIIAGNVATYEGAWDLFEAGANSVKVGVGPGSVCTTRIVTGCGVPQLTAIMEASRAADDFYRHSGIRPTVIADGGIKTSGDIVKALAAGASTVMLGSLLSGTDEAPGEVITIGDKKYKSYRGMASTSAQKSIGVSRKAEGVDALVPYKGSVVPIIKDLMEGVRSGLSYLNCSDIDTLHRRDIEFVRISSASKQESHPHIRDIAVAVEV